MEIYLYIYTVVFYLYNILLHIYAYAYLVFIYTFFVVPQPSCGAEGTEHVVLVTFDRLLRREGREA